MSSSLLIPGLKGHGRFSNVMHNLRSRAREFPGEEKSDSKKEKPTKAETKRLKAKVRREMRLRKLFPGMSEAVQRNPKAYGAPRLFKVQFMDRVPENEVYSDVLSSCRILFGSFGDKHGGIVLDNFQVAPDKVKFTPDTKTYSFHVQHPPFVGPAEGGTPAPTVESLSGLIDFNLDVPAGQISVGARTFNVALEAEPLKFDAEVSHNAGAQFSSGKDELTFDPSSVEWQNATWDADVEFWYNIRREFDPIINETLTHIENWFVDKASPSGPFIFELTRDKEAQFGEMYASSATAVDGGNIHLATNVDRGKYIQQIGQEQSGIPYPAPGRTDRTVQSVFPLQSLHVFDPFGIQFEGAYMVHENAADSSSDIKVYGIKGTAKSPFGRSSSAASLSSIASENLPAKDVGLPGARANSDLSVFQLMNMTPIEDGVDVCFERAMDDFYEIIIHYMEEDLRQTFVQQTPIILPEAVKAIAEDNIEANREFYRSLQAPFLASALSSSSLDGAGELNAVRAEAMLREIPNDNETYKSQFGKLYRRHFLNMNDIMPYLEDQQGRSDGDLDLIIDYLVDDVTSSSPPGGYPLGDGQTVADAVDAAVADVQALGEYAKQKKLYWAMTILYFTRRYSLDIWYNLFTNGQDKDLSLTVKGLTTVLQYIENEQTSDTGDSVTQTFLEMVEVWQMTSIIPTYISLDGNEEQIDSIMDEILSSYLEAIATSPPQSSNIISATENAGILLQEKEGRLKLLKALVAAWKTVEVGAGPLHFSAAVVKAQGAVNSKAWFQALNKTSNLMSAFAGFVGVAMITMFLMGGQDFSKLEPGEKAQFVVAAAVTSFYGVPTTIQLGTSLFRVMNRYLLAPVIKRVPGLRQIYTFAGRKLAALGNLLSRATQYAQAKLVSAALKFAPTSIKAFQKMWGKHHIKASGGLFALLAIVTIALSSKEISKNPDMPAPEKAAHSLFITSGILSLASIAIGGLTAAGYISAATLATALSFAAGAFAIVGLIVFLVFAFTQDPETPLEELVRVTMEPLGLRMDEEKLAIDYLLDMPARSEDAETLGVSIKGVTSRVSSGKQRFVSFANETAALGPRATLQYSEEDVWNIDTDMNGKTTINARRYVPTQDSDGNTTTNPDDYIMEFWYLSAAPNNSDVILVQYPSSDDSEYETKLAKLQWEVSIASSDRTEVIDSEDEGGFTQLSSATCRIHNPAAGKSLNAVVQGSSITKFNLSSRGEAQWKITREPRFFSSFSYSPNPWELITDALDERITPSFTPFQVSQGLDWSISPPLPEPFELITEAGNDEGMIRMKDGEPLLGVMEPTTFVVTCSKTTPNGQAFSRSTEVTIQVLTKEEVMAAAVED